MSITLKQASNQHAFNDIRLWYYTNDVALRDAIESHVHDGINDAKVDHTGLLNIGTLTHAELETAISTNTSNLTSHEGDTDVHIQTGERTDWDGVVTEVVAARNSAAKSTVYNTLDERLEAIENESSVTAHGSLTGLHTEATGSGDSESRHKALAIWDVTGSRTLQAAIDAMVSAISGLDTDKMDTADFATTFNAQTSGALDGDKIETATGANKGTVQFGTSAGTAAEGNHSHTYATGDIDVAEIGTNMDGASETSGTNLNTLLANLGSVFLQGLVNLIPNGTFIYKGCDPSNRNRYLIDNATADLSPTLNYETGVPGWTLTRGNSTTTVKLESSVTPAATPSPELTHHASSNNVDYNYSYARLQVSDASADSFGGIVSDSFNTTTAGVTFSMRIYNRNAYTQELIFGFGRYVSGTGWVTEGITDHTILPAQTWKTFRWYVSCMSGKHRINVILPTTTSNGADIDIESIMGFNGNITSIVGFLPQKCHWIIPSHETAFSNTANTPPTPGENRQNRPTYKTKYECLFPVNSSFTGTPTVTIPNARYVYNVKVTPSWLNMQDVVGAMDMPLPTPIDYRVCTDFASRYNFSTSPITSISLALPIPTSGTEYYDVEVEYWPADV